jgi:hypothetical protein
MKNLPETKKGKILAHLQSGRTITPAQALQYYGHFRLASCINRLRNEGYNIKTTIRQTIFKEPYAEYELLKS